MGLTTATKLWLPFFDGATADRSGSAHTVTAVSTGGAPEWAEGPYGDAIQFRSSVSRLDVTGTAKDIAGDLSIEFAFRSESNAVASALVAQRATNGSEKDRLWIGIDTTSITAIIYDGAGASTTVTCAIPLPYVNASLTNARYHWHHIRLAVDVGAFVYLFFDGLLVGKAATTIAAFDTASAGPLQIGGEASSTATSQFTGRIADLHIRSECDTSVNTLSPNLGARRTTRRHVTADDYDLPEMTEGDTWTSSGGGYYIAAADLDIGALILDREDIVSVKATTSAGVVTTFTELGNATDVLAGTNNWGWAHATRRIYVSENPTGYTAFAVAVRVRVADRRLRRGDRWYIPALASIDHPERRFAWWEQAWQSGAGGKFAIAKHADLPTALGNEEATSIVWTNATARTRTISDGMPWSESVIESVGFIDASPTDEPDRWVAQSYHEPARLYRVPMGERIADKATYPYMFEGYNGHAWPIVIGAGHLRIKAICIDTRPQTVGGATGLIRWKVIATPETGTPGLTFMQMGVGATLLTSPQMYSVDLDVGEFYTKQIVGFPADVWVDCAGWGTPTDPTSTPGTPVISWGSALDCDLGGELIGKRLLGLAGITSFGSTWAATFARAAGYWRVAEGLPDNNALSKVLQRWMSDMLVYVYFDPDAETWECEDVVKADSSEWTVRDEDVIDVEWLPDRSMVSRRANVIATEYTRTTSGEVVKGAATTLQLTGQARAATREVYTPERMSGLTTVGSVDLWLPKVQATLENTTHMVRLTLGSAYRGIEQFDVLTVSLSSLPTGAEARFRILSVKPSAAGRVTVDAFPEVHWPSTGVSVSATRTGGSPFYVTTFRGSQLGSTELPVKSAWTTISYGFMEDNPALTYPTDVTDRFNVEAQRVGGAADTDLKFRLAAGTTIAGLSAITTTAGCSTTMTTQTATTFTRPTARRLIALQYYLEAAATRGLLMNASWQAKEGSTNTIAMKLLPSTTWETSYVPGAICPATSGWTIIPKLGGGVLSYDFMRPGAEIVWNVYASGATGTGFELSIQFVRLGPSPTPTYWPGRQYIMSSIAPGGVGQIATFGAITTEGIYTVTGANPVYGMTQVGFRLCYKCTSGYGTVWASAMAINQVGH